MMMEMVLSKCVECAGYNVFETSMNFDKRKREPNEWNWIWLVKMGWVSNVYLLEKVYF